MESAGRRLAPGRDPRPLRPAGARRQPGRHDPDLPENQRKADAVRQLTALAEASGLTIVQVALGFVLEHPAVFSAIIAPRTQDHLTTALAAADVRLTADVLDEIDRIVPPGMTLNAADAGYRPPPLTDPSRRRRALSRTRWRRTGAPASAASLIVSQKADVTDDLTPPRAAEPSQPHAHHLW